MQCLLMFILVANTACLVKCQRLNNIYVDPVNGSDTSDCLVPNNPSQPCKNLSYALQYRNNSAQYVLLPGQHYLDDSAYVNPIASSGVAISANSSVTIECLGPNASIAFIGASNIHLENVTFYKCAGLYNSTSRNFATAPKLTMYQFKVALYFYLCQNVTMSNIVVTESPNATGVVMYDTIGTNVFTNSNFTINSVHHIHQSLYPGGGGFYIEFTYCTPGGDDCSNNPSSAVTSDSTYEFSNCIFTNNSNHGLFDPHSSWFVLPYHTFHDAFGRGGGLSIFFKGNASNNTFTISNCDFIHNKAVWGGGLVVNFYDSTIENTVVIHNSTFLENWCSFTSGAGGGGMSISHNVFDEGEAGREGNRILIQGSNFTNNSAANGGGLAIFAALQNSESGNELASIFVNNSDFVENKARLGAGVYISRFMLIIQGEMLHVHISSSNFTSNSVVNSTPIIYQEGVGAMYVNRVPVHFHGSILFIGNNGTALGIVGTYVDFMNCTANFIDNIGYEGGGIALLGTAWILINEETSMNFTNNIALAKGGAIYNKYIEKEDLQVTPNCFIHHFNSFLFPDQWNATFVFQNNIAYLHGSSIYSTSILPCARAASGSSWRGNPKDIFCWNKWIYSSQNCTREIGSDAGHIKSNGSASTFPGKVFTLQLEITDDLGHNVNKYTVFTASTKSTRFAAVDPNYSYVTQETIRMTGKENTSLLLTLDSASERVWHVDFQVKLSSCPPGLKISNNVAQDTIATSECICSKDYKGRLRCDPIQQQAKLQNSYWYGQSPYTVGHKMMVITLCPNGFCNIDNNEAFLHLPNSTGELDAFICGKVHRTGTICGECIKAYGPAVNSDIYECIHCDNADIALHIIVYMLSVYLPLFLFFIAIIVFNIRLTTGPANAFVLYSQLISSTFYLDADGHIPMNMVSSHPKQLHRIQKAYRVLYGIFNLEFVENFISPLCLGTGLNTLDVLQLNYAVALFPLLMIVLVIFFLRMKSLIKLKCFRQRPRDNRRSRLFPSWRMGQSLLHAFAAFVLLSYTKFILTSSYIAIHQYLIDENGAKLSNGARQYHPRVFHAGQFATNDPTYVLRYLLPACVVLVIFAVFLPLLLLEYPVKLLERLINKVHCLRRFYPVDKIHILLDTFQGCYRNNMRFFAGLYFIFRLAINVSYIATDGWLSQYTVQQITCLTFIVLIALCQPYNNKILNYIDILIFTNLAILNALSLYLYEYGQTYPSEQLPLAFFILQYILVFIPVIYMASYMIWHLSKPHRKIKHFASKYLAWCGCGDKEERRLECTDTLGSIVDERVPTSDVVIEEHDEMEALLKRAEETNMYRPRCSQSMFGIAAMETHPVCDDDSGLQIRQSSRENYGSINPNS